MSPNARKQERSLADAAAQRVGASRGASSPWSTALRELGTVDRAGVSGRRADADAFA